MKDLLTFDKMITPQIITIIYWLCLLFVVITGLTTIFTGTGGFLFRLLMGILILVFGSLLARVYCEIMIVLFKIHENIKTLAER